MRQMSRAAGSRGRKVPDPREDGFSNYFSGANKDRAIEKDRINKERSRSKHAPQHREKKGWNDNRDSEENSSDRKPAQRASRDRYQPESSDEEIAAHRHEPQRSKPNQWATRRNEQKKASQTLPSIPRPASYRNKHDDPVGGYTMNLEDRSEPPVQKFMTTKEIDEIQHSILEMDDQEVEQLQRSVLGKQFRTEGSTKEKIKLIVDTLKKNADNEEFIATLYEVISQQQSHKHKSKPFLIRQSDSSSSAKGPQVSADHRGLDGRADKSDTLLPKDPLSLNKKPNFRLGSANSSSAVESNKSLKKETPKESIDSSQARKPEEADFKKKTSLVKPIKESSNHNPSDNKQSAREPQEGEVDALLCLPDEFDLDSHVKPRPPQEASEKKPVVVYSKKPEPKEAHSNEKPKVSHSLFESAVPEDMLAQQLILSQNSVVVRLWGSIGGASNEVGIVALQIFDETGKEIDLKEKEVIVAGFPATTGKKLLSDPLAVSREELRLEFPMLSSFVDIRIKYFGPDPATVRVWSKPQSAPIRSEVEIIVNEKNSTKIVVTGSPVALTAHDICVAPQCTPPPNVLQSQASSKQEENQQLKKKTQDLVASNVYQNLFGEDCAAKTEVNHQAQTLKQSTRRRREANVIIGQKKRTSEDIDSNELAQLLASDDRRQRSGNTAPEHSLETGTIINQPKSSAPSKQLSTDYRSRRDQLKQRNAKEQAPLQDNLSQFIAQMDTRPNIPQTRTPLEPRFQPPVVIGSSQLLNLDMEDSLVITPSPQLPAAIQKPKVANQQPKDALDELNNKIEIVRKIEKRNMSKIELSGIDFASSIIQPEPKQLHQQHKKTANELGERYTYFSFADLLRDNEYFTLPELPRGQVLDFDLYSTWGDKFFVGLAGIEVFDEKGKPVRISPNCITAEPSSLNTLPDVQEDPRTVDHLIDGEYLTKDDLHCWLAPIRGCPPNRVTVDLRTRTCISLIRIWNYNKDRVHASRGAREVAIKIDGMLMFFGEVVRGTGEQSAEGRNSEWIFFTHDPVVLKLLEANDWFTAKDLRADETSGQQFATAEVRPSTGSRPDRDGEGRELSDIRRQLQIQKQKMELLELEHRERARRKEETLKNTPKFIECQKLSIQITENWGDPFIVGLHKLEFFDEAGRSIPLRPEQLRALPRDIRSEDPASNYDPRVLENLLRADGSACDVRSHWATPLKPQGQNFLYVHFDDRLKLSGMRVWNYNTSPEEVSAGAKKIEITADLTKITNQFVFLKCAPGNSYQHSSQFVPFPPPRSRELLRQPAADMVLFQLSLPPKLPTGFSLKFIFRSTWGDHHYVGLNGLEVFDKKARPLLASKVVGFSVCADPQDLRELPGMETDLRQLDNLFDGVNTGTDDANSWLAPFIHPYGSQASNLRRTRNELAVDFVEPVSISAIKLWNYAKTPRRGVREFEVQLDGATVFVVAEQ